MLLLLLIFKEIIIIQFHKKFHIFWICNLQIEDRSRYNLHRYVMRQSNGTYRSHLLHFIFSSLLILYERHLNPHPAPLFRAAYTIRYGT